MANRLWMTAVWSALLAVMLAFAPLPVRAGTVGSIRTPAVGHVELYFFINGDNDLVSRDLSSGRPLHQGQKAFEQLSELAAKSRQGISFHLYYDPNSGLLPVGASQDTVIRRYRDGKLVSEKLYGETDSGDSRWLQLLLSERFEQTAFRILSFWGHGEGWRDVGSFDFSAPEKSFSYVDAAPVLRDQDLDLILFDACQMAFVEVLSAFQGSARYLVASEYELPVDGVNYENLQQHLTELLADGNDPDAFARALHKRLNADTRRTQSALGVFAPLALYSLAGLPAFLEKFNPFIAELQRRVRADDWLSVVSWAGEAGATDLRALLARLKATQSWDASTLLDAYGAIAPGKYGSVLFYLPEELGRIPSSSLKDELEIQSRKPWTKDLGNWDLVRSWLR